MNNKLSFDYTLTLDPCDIDSIQYITYEEQVIIERWLTSPKFSSDLYVINDNEDILATYCGKFVRTSWRPWEDGFIAVDFTFENNSAYAKEKHNFYYEGLSDNWTFMVDCDTDELEEYTYPVITITNPDGGHIVLTNTTDTGAINSIDVLTHQDVPMVIDCRHCILTDGVTNATLSFDDIGWTDVGNIYWPRLLPGVNTFTVDKPCQIEMSFETVSKKVGGWLYD